ncbi:MAG: DUF5667 domain-containing protein [Dehalococcoidia bacterium]
MKKFEDILAQCIEDIKGGKASIEECLDRHPALRGQLEPLLRTALAIREPREVKASDAFKAKARVQLMEQIDAWQTATKWPWHRRNNDPSAASHRRRFSFNMANIIIAVVLTLSLVGGGTVYASQSSLPGDALYTVKLATEELTMGLAGGDIARAERALTFAERRVREMKALAARGRSQDLNLAAENYACALNLTLANMEQARNRRLDAANVTARVAEATTRHLSVLDRVWDMVPDQAKAAIAHARNVSQTGYFHALAALAKNNTVLAAEMNLAAMQRRLERIEETAQDEEALQIALQQFEAMSEFNEEIYRIAEQFGLNATQVEELVAEASGKHLERLAEVWEKVPDQAKPAIERAMANAMKRYQRRLQRLEQRGGAVPPSPGIFDRVRQRIEERIRQQEQEEEQNQEQQQEQEQDTTAASAQGLSQGPWWEGDGGKP